MIVCIALNATIFYVVLAFEREKMKIYYKIIVMEQEIEDGEKEISNYCVSFESVMDDLRKEFGNWAKIIITFPGIPKSK
jgi:hypothetical protein